MNKFLRWLLNEPPVHTFDPSLVVAYRGSYIRVNASKVIYSGVTAILANGSQVDLSESELENLLQDDLYFCGDHPLVAAMRANR